MEKQLITKNNQLFARVAEIIDIDRKKVVSSVNLTMVHTYFEIGRMIIEDEQQGKERAEYGKFVLKDLSKQLTEKFGKGFSPDNLENMRKFYLAYSISETVSRKFILSWSHYLVLMKIENPQERSFYEIESAENDWSLRELKRQYN